MQSAMLTRILACMFVAALGMIPVGTTLADDYHGYGKGKSRHGRMLEGQVMPGYEHMKGHHESVSPIAMKEELGLNDDQIKKLEPLESDYRKMSIKNRADLKITMIDLSALLDQNNPDKNAISKKVDEIADIQKSMMRYRVDTMFKLKGILTSPQYEKYRGELKEHMEHRMGQGKHDIGEMMHHGTRGEHENSHGKTEDTTEK